MLVLITVTILAIMLIIVCRDKKVEYIIKREQRNNRYLVPKSFWEESNQIEIWIYEMTLDEADIVRFKIQQFCDKYEQIASHNTYNTRVANMLTNYQNRYSYLLTKKQKQNGITV